MVQKTGLINHVTSQIIYINWKLGGVKVSLMIKIDSSLKSLEHLHASSYENVKKSQLLAFKFRITSV